MILRENSKSKTHNSKKTRIKNSQNHILIRICSKIISTNMIAHLQDKISRKDILLFLEKNKKNLYFAYNKSDYQTRNCYFKKKMISNKSLILEFM